MLVRACIVSVRGFTADMQLCRADAGARDALCPDRLAIDSQAAERASKILEWQAGVDQRAEHHVPGRAGEAIEVENLQAPTILS